MANAITNFNQVIPKLVAQVDNLQQLVTELSTTNSRPSFVSTDISSISSTTNEIASNGYIFPLRMNKYCWTHDLCGHNGSVCRAKADGHKDNATYDNRMGGSNERQKARN